MQQCVERINLTVCYAYVGYYGRCRRYVFEMSVCLRACMSAGPFSDCLVDLYFVNIISSFIIRNKYVSV